MRIPFLVLLTAVIAVLILAVFVVVRLLGRTPGRRAGAKPGRIEQEARRLDLGYAAKGDKEFRGRFADLPEIPRGATIKHVMPGRVGDRPVVVFEVSYMIHTGQAPIMIAHTVYAAESPQWPVTHITPRNILGRLMVTLGRQPGLAMENVEFNRRFNVRTHDEEFAIALLSPEMQEFILSKRSARWRICPGRLCLIYRGSVKFDRMETSLQRMDRFWELVPPELERW